MFYSTTQYTKFRNTLPPQPPHTVCNWPQNNILRNIPCTPANEPFISAKEPSIWCQSPHSVSIWPQVDTQKSPVLPHTNTVFLQMSPLFPQKNCLFLQKSSLFLQKSDLYFREPCNSERDGQLVTVCLSLCLFVYVCVSLSLCVSVWDCDMESGLTQIKRGPQKEIQKRH